MIAFHSNYDSLVEPKDTDSVFTEQRVREINETRVISDKNEREEWTELLKKRNILSFSRTEIQRLVYGTVGDYLLKENPPLTSERSHTKDEQAVKFMSF